MRDETCTPVELPRYSADDTPVVKVPAGRTLGPVTGVQVTPDGHIWVLHIAATTGYGQSTSRQNPRLPPVIEFDENGNFLQAWGGPDHLPRIDGNPQWPRQEEMISFDDEGTLWIFGANKQYDHAVQRFTRDGELLLRIGEFGKPGNDESPDLLGTPTDAHHDVARREVYITDGYVNHRVAVFDSDTGAFLRSWGAYGATPPFPSFGRETFSNPVHAIDLGPDGYLYVCDRKNDRVQVFDAIGRKDARFVREIGIDIESPFGSIFNLVFTPCGNFMILSDGTHSRLLVVDRKQWKIVDVFTLPDLGSGDMRSTVHKITSDREGNLLFARGPRGIQRMRFDGLRAGDLSESAIGEATGLSIPPHGEALRAGGPDFLTEAFHAFGSLPADNAVARVARFDECREGGTGQKFRVAVDYDQPDPKLHRELFVKFSRDFDDPLRDDLGKYAMQPEVALAALAGRTRFPIAVPQVYFADYDRGSHTGVLIAERIPFGEEGIEPLRHRCRDHESGDAISHYRAVVRALAKVVAADKSGALGEELDAIFPFDRQKAATANSLRYNEGQLRERIARYADFAAYAPQLLPANIRETAFLERLESGAMRFVEHKAAISQFLQRDPDLIALAHPAATLDNAWFWRDEAGALQCGLLDWGDAGRMNVAAALWGCLVGAQITIWDEHLDALLELFVDEVGRNGGPSLDLATFKLHFELHAAMTGLNYFLDFPAKILFRLPEAVDASGPFDAIFDGSETARCELSMLSLFLNFWETRDLGVSLDRLLAVGAEAVGG